MENKTVDVWEYRKVLRKIERQKLLKDFLLSFSFMKENILAAFIALEFLTIQKIQQENFDFENREDEILAWELWEAIFPKLEIRFSGNVSYLCDQEKDQVIVFIKKFLLEDKRQNFLFTKHLFQEINFSYYRITEVPEIPTHSFGMITTSEKFCFLSSSVSLDMKMFKDH